MNKAASIFLAVIIFCSSARATTWDEPWQERIVKEADYFVFAKILSSDEQKGLSIQILRSFSKSISGNINITDFHLLKLCSTTGGHGPEFHFDGIDSAYFFIKKNGDNYAIATPTSGFAVFSKGKVYATYRHSYHQASVAPKVYEKTMTAIFNSYHGLAYDKEYINGYITKYLTIKPASLDKAELDNFFNQHVALETVYHLRLSGYYEQILPFFEDSLNFHHRCRLPEPWLAVIRLNLKTH